MESFQRSDFQYVTRTATSSKRHYGQKRLQAPISQEHTAVGGKSLLVWTIEAARASGRITDYLVSSEDQEVLAVAKEYYAPTPFVRPRELAGDEVRNTDTLRHAMEFMDRATGRPYDILILLQPTCPVRDPTHIDQAVERLWASDLDTAVSLKGPFKKRDPILKAVRQEVVEEYVPLHDNSEPEPFYLYNASIYAMKRAYFTTSGKFVSPRQVPLIMDQYHSIDIDTQADLLVAEAYLRHLGKVQDI